MEALLQSLATKYGFDYAAKLLGLDQKTQNPKYAISFGGMEFDPLNMIKRAGLNQGFKAITGGSSMGMALPLIAGGLGLAYYRNPLREGAPNYNPNLKGQMDYLSSRNILGTDQSGLTKIMSGPLQGKNLVSMFGTNDYEKMLDKKIDYFQKRKDKGKGYSHDNYMKLLDEREKVTKDIGGDRVSDNTGGDPGSKGASDQFSNRTGRGRRDYAQGGIASLWQK